MGRLLAAELPDQLENVQRAVSVLPDGHTKQSLLVMISNTKQASVLLNQTSNAAYEMEKLQENIEQWFNNAMARVGGWYKRWTQKIILAISAILVLAANVDTIMLAESFYLDNNLRGAVVAVANSTVQNNLENPTENNIARENLLREAGKLVLPLGWVPSPEDPYKFRQVPNCSGVPLSECFFNWGLKLLGLLMSVVAVGQGAPFWFDLLNKVTNLRSAGLRPEESTKNESHPTASPLLGNVSTIDLRR